MPCSCVASAIRPGEPCCFSAFPSVDTISEVQPHLPASRSSSFASRCSSRHIKVIATDLDGTFLNADHKVSCRNAAAFRAAKKAGYTVLVATGRSRLSAVEGMGKEALEEMDYVNTAPAVFMNGMVVYGTDGELLYEHSMSKDHLRLLLEFVRKEGLMNNFLIYEGPNIWCEHYNEYTAMPHVAYGEVNPKVVEGPIDQMKCNKAVICAPDEVLIPVQKKIKEKFGDLFDCFNALPKFLEMVPKGANKMTGISYLLRSIGVEPASVMAIGDSENDCDLLRGIGCPVAVGNACVTAKSIAKHIVNSHDKDSFADAVEKLCGIVV